MIKVKVLENSAKCATLEYKCFIYSGLHRKTGEFETQNLLLSQLSSFDWEFEVKW